MLALLVSLEKDGEFVAEPTGSDGEKQLSKYGRNTEWKGKA